MTTDSIEVSVLTDGEASVAQARNQYFQVTGSSKKHPKDTPDATVGSNLAVARALRAMADKYEAMAEEAQADPILSSTGTSITFSSPHTITYTNGKI